VSRREAERVRAAYARRAARGDDERYSLLNPANLYMYQRRERALLSMLRRHGLAPLAGRRIVDVGCGSGGLLADFLRYGARAEDLAGADLLAERIESARRRFPAIAFAVADASALPYAGASFDVALQFTLLSSVRDRAMRESIAAETLRVLRPGGALVWYDFIWNPLNRDVRGIGLRELRRLYAGCAIDARRGTLAPPISRRLSRGSWTVCRLLEAAAPWLCSHYLAVVEKR